MLRDGIKVNEWWCGSGKEGKKPKWVNVSGSCQTVKEKWTETAECFGTSTKMAQAVWKTNQWWLDSSFSPMPHIRFAICGSEPGLELDLGGRVWMRRAPGRRNNRKNEETRREWEKIFIRRTCDRRLLAYPGFIRSHKMHTPARTLRHTHTQTERHTHKHAHLQSHTLSYTHWHTNTHTNTCTHHTHILCPTHAHIHVHMYVKR